MEESYTPSQRIGIRVRELPPADARPMSAHSNRLQCVVGSCDTPVDPLQLVWSVNRDPVDFVNF